MTVSLAALIYEETKAAILAKGLDVATLLGLPVTSWQPGDPTRSLYHYLAEILSTNESVVARYIKAGFLDYAAAQAIDDDDDTWLVLLAEQVYGYTARAATYASGTVTLTNSSGFLYTIGAGDLTLKNSTTGATYHNTTGGTLASGPGTTLDITVVADDAGSAGSSGATDIDMLVTVLLDVACSNASALTGIDAEDAASIVAGCRAKLASLSPNGPADAYVYVATNSELTTTTGVTRARSSADSTTGAVTVYLAGPSGAVSAGDVTLAQTAILEYATPLCVTPTVSSASNKSVSVTYQLWYYDSLGKTDLEMDTEIAAALAAMFGARPIGGDIIPPAAGYVYKTMIESTIRAVYPDHCFRVSVTAPAADVAIAANEVPVLGAIGSTHTPVAAP